MCAAKEKPQGDLISPPGENSPCGSRSGRTGDSPPLRVGARSSPLSRAQVDEIASLLGLPLLCRYVMTTGDLDRTTSLRLLGKTDFFTRELDRMLKEGEIDAAIHSAKDLPDPIPQGLQIAAITKGVDASDSLVMQEGTTVHTLKRGALIATSSERREASVRELRPDCSFCDVRGTIHERLKLLEQGIVEGVVIAEAALIRLNLTHLNRIRLPGETTPLQGRLAVVVREGDRHTYALFRTLHDPQSGIGT